MSMKKFRTSILVVMTILAMSSHLALAQTPDPLAVVQASIAAINRGDVAAALATFADDATFNRPPGSYTGKAQIRQALQADAAVHTHVEASNFRATGDQVTFSFRQSNDQLRRMGIDALVGTTTMTVQGGKITLFQGTLSPASQARLQQALAAAPQGMPNTGARGVPLVLLLALGGLGLLAGVGLRRRRWR